MARTTHAITIVDTGDFATCKFMANQVRLALLETHKVRYCQVEKDGTEIYCKKNDGDVRLISCSEKGELVDTE